uniref:Uncharacterized protein n=1 Tax=Arundo donax TaxID=35708 RepID=A0A0A9B2Y4_ARUDO
MVPLRCSTVCLGSEGSRGRRG